MPEKADEAIPIAPAEALRIVIVVPTITAASWLDLMKSVVTNVALAILSINGVNALPDSACISLKLWDICFEAANLDSSFFFKAASVADICAVLSFNILVNLLALSPVKDTAALYALVCPNNLCKDSSSPLTALDKYSINPANPLDLSVASSKLIPNSFASFLACSVGDIMASITDLTLSIATCALVSSSVKAAVADINSRKLTPAGAATFDAICRFLVNSSTEDLLLSDAIASMLAASAAVNPPEL